MIGVNQLAKAYGARTLFEDVTLKLVTGSRYGLVGANGSGKTTFLEIVAGDEEASEGSVAIDKGARVGVLRQDRFMNDEEPILDVAMAGDELVTKALADLKREGDPERLVELEDLVRAHDGYTLEARASAILEGLGIPTAQHRLPLRTLSGGFKLRVLLAQVLLGGPDVLLLDEPTNHLDILSIRWLEKFLTAYKGCAVVISHDQRFLDNVATDILDVDYGTITLYPGNYSAFSRDKVAIRERKEADLERKKETIAEKRAWVERFGAKATKATQAQSRVKQIEKLEESLEDLASSSRRAPKFHFESERKSGRDVLEIAHVSKAYGEKKVLVDVSVVVRRGERVAIIGPNGLGKSTLLKIATGKLDADAGAVKWGHETRVGYFAQDHHEALTNPDQTPIDFVWDAVPKAETAFVRGALGRVMFSGDDVKKKVGALSGGEAARLVFCRIMVERPNVLVLDEPTNHLDLEAIEGLSEALKQFEDGTIVFVSHDRAFVSALATRILEVTPSGFRDFPGTYEEYLARCGDDHLDADAVVLRAKRDAAPKEESANQKSWEEQKKIANRKKQLPAKRDAALAAIEAAEARKAAIHARWCEPGYYEQTPAAEIATLEEEERALGPKIEQLYAEWEAIEAEIASLEST
ncbi:MAG: ABC-F family ATP-binding cassette domain-containing protein [Labilithrix sp.]|nr:ABC-F family ATP-binding cassette domain-containing protein [Labilithrix sp.]MCW5817367.1 ABC-F family ATP-binding cassette domain-containing protein [Labilithrix sp.]